VFNGFSDRRKARKLERKRLRRERAHRLAAEHDARMREQGGRRRNGRFGRGTGGGQPALDHGDGEDSSEPSVSTKGRYDETT